ncbi:MAG: right-handed parallel beta-helix repeat-containing protein [Bacteroidaceae bacterium]|nr:right-handed parallel beta-helix repeat-containing protein [Bacteroidaceae bacterium]
MNNSASHPSGFFLVIFFVFLTLGCCMRVETCFAKTVLEIKSQKDFDVLSVNLLEHLTKGEKNIVVNFAKGKYYYKTLHIYFDDRQFPDASISFKGNGSTIISAGNDLIKDGPIVKYREGAGFIDANGKDYENYSRMFQSDNLVDIVDEKSKLCRIHCPELANTGNIDCPNAYLRLTSWFTSYLYHVTKISDGYVYFTADNLAPGYSQYGNFNVNYDYTVGKIMPRFRLINVSLGGCQIEGKVQGVINRSSERVIHQCEAGFFIFLQNCSMKRLAIEGFRVIGCRADCQTIRFRNMKAESIIISNLTLSGARGMTIYAESTDNVIIKNCEFYDNYRDVVNISNTCNNSVIKNNLFYNNGKGVVNSFCIICRGGNYLIANNVIRDFNYGAIGVGVWHKSAKGSYPSYGIVERNHIYYTSDYIKEKAEWTLVDGGAIYLWTKNDDAVIRHNFIHDYEGMGSNRGIYCDDGTNNCSIYGNIVLNINNCRAIDLRRSKTIENAPVGQRSNENNHIFGNVFNNDFLFEGRDDDSTSVKGRNTILVNSEVGMPKITVKNVIEESQDKISEYKEKMWYRRGRKLVL